MFKRLLLTLALGAALVACSPTGSGSSTGTETLAPVDSAAPSDVAPSDGLPSVDPSASPS